MADVVVVGAGPTGLAVAGELARRGVTVRVLDAAPAPSRGSRGKGMQPRTLELLDPLGVADRLVSLGRFELPIRRHEPDGTHHDALMYPEARPAPDRPWYRGLMLPQWRTEQVLRERLAELGVSVEQDAEVVDLTQDDDGVVLALADGSSVATRYVVGADGGRSAVRHALGVPFVGETREEIRMLLADVELEGLDRDHWHQWGGGPGAPRSDMLALCPLPASPLWQLQAGLADRERTFDRLPDERELTELLARCGPRVRVRRVDWASIWRLNVRLVERYRVGRAVLAGDAAHVHSPAGAQGMNTGIGDAVNLGWKLAAVLHGADEALLDTYDAERRPVAACVLGLSTRLGGTPFLGRSVDGADVLQFAVGYAGGPLADGGSDAAGGPAPGERAPDAVLDALPDGDTVFLARRRGEWTVLAFGVEAPDLPLPGLVGMRVDDGPAWAIYGAVPGELVLLRPDGHVAARATDAAVLTDWVARWGLGADRRVSPHASAALSRHE